MHRLQLLACATLTLALLATSAPTSSSIQGAQQQLEQLLLDLQLLQKGVENHKNLRVPRMFKFYLPKKATELKHLQCLAEELNSLEEVLTLAQGKNAAIKDLMSNINVTVLGLQGSETSFTCDYEDEPVSLTDFLTRWITSCQGIFSTLA
ncbi:interleukin-2 [Sorex fumeus]|uniref:interleukin-2 n=1 Tax=Sorex fumeus TaxID=62283 RepID=UPI0024AE3CEC|nr:interleukin-2 [Sorex fumeus]